MMKTRSKDNRKWNIPRVASLKKKDFATPKFMMDRSLESIEALKDKEEKKKPIENP